MSFWLRFKKQIIISVGIFILIVSCLIQFFLKPTTSSQKQNNLQVLSQEESVKKLPKDQAKQPVNQKGYVDLKGAVKKPGLYQICPEKTRLFTIVKQAGGVLDDADLSTINLSQTLQDQLLIYIPKKGEVPKEAMVAANTDTVSPNNDQVKINLNQATVEQLQTLNGIGPKKATQIIEFRQEKGAFKQLEDLKEVPGIGDKTFEQLSAYLSVN